MTAQEPAGSLWRKAVPLIVVVFGIFVLVSQMEELGWLQRQPTHAPDFDLPNLGARGDADGRSQLAALRGRPLIVNFWASWCNQCKEERPLLRTLGEQAKSGSWRGTLLGISTADALGPATAAVAHGAMPYFNAFDEGDEVAKRYAITALPHTLLIDKDGKIVKRYSRVLTAEDLPTLIKHLR